MRLFSEKVDRDKSDLEIRNKSPDAKENIAVTESNYGDFHDIVKRG